VQPVDPGDRLDALRRRLAEADAGVEHDAFARDAGLARNAERAREERLDVGHDVDRRVGLVAIMHDHDRCSVLGHDRGHVGVALQAPHVVDHGGALGERPAGHLGLHRVDRDRRAERADGREHRRESAPLLLGAHPHGAAIGARRLGADVDDVGAVCDHLSRVGDRPLRVDEFSAVGERVGREVEHPHDHGTARREQPVEPPGGRLPRPRMHRHMIADRRHALALRAKVRRCQVTWREGQWAVSS
jgi:hypothetical protein